MKVLILVVTDKIFCVVKQAMKKKFWNLIMTRVSSQFLSLNLTSSLITSIQLEYNSLIKLI